MPKQPNKTKNTIRVLERFYEDPTAEIHGFRLIEELKIKSGIVYPLLNRLEGLGWLESRWEESDRPGPRKRLYRLTAKGAPAVREFLEGARPEGSKRTTLGGFASPEPA